MSTINKVDIGGTVYEIEDTVARANSLGVTDITQAAYNALSTAEKTNGTIYHITDALYTPEAGGTLISLSDYEALSDKSGVYYVSDSTGTSKLVMVNGDSYGGSGDGGTVISKAEYDALTDKSGTYYVSDEHEMGNAYKIVGDTLSAGDTELSFTDALIAKENVFIDVYSNVAPVDKKHTATNKITLYFEAQETDLSVVVKLTEF